MLCLKVLCFEALNKIKLFQPATNKAILEGNNENIQAIDNNKASEVKLDYNEFVEPIDCNTQKDRHNNDLLIFVCFETNTAAVAARNMESKTVDVDNYIFRADAYLECSRLDVNLYESKP